ncbi:MAG: hypothetical protein ACKO8G_06130 [Actinomycetota bacterium]
MRLGRRIHDVDAVRTGMTGVVRRSEDGAEVERQLIVQVDRHRGRVLAVGITNDWDLAIDYRDATGAGVIRFWRRDDDGVLRWNDTYLDVREAPRP